MSTVYNFCAGPAMLPVPVMQQVQQELINWNDLGVSVMEVSHRSKEFIALANQAEADLRELMAIGDDYHVLFMHGGGRGQFAAVVNNFLGNEGRALYLTAGQWSEGAAVEAEKLLGKSRIDRQNIVSLNDGIQRVTLPELKDEQQGYRYVHYCPNETVDGIEIFDNIDSPWPLVADMSSTILSREIDVSRFGLIYAGAQKNIGPSGLAIVIVRKDMLTLPTLPQSSIMNYAMEAQYDSMLNTPPTFAWYLAAQVFKWLKSLGGVSQIAKINQQKAQLLYRTIDNSDFYQNNIAHDNRSKMNVTFSLKDSSKNELFLSRAASQGLVTLKGHRLVGGMRASIYNAMPLEGVQKLVAFMEDFARQHA